MPSPSSRTNQAMRNLRCAVLLGVVLSILVACGGPTPTPVVLVVTSTFTPEPVVKVVTATFTPTPEVSSAPTETALPQSPAQPTDTPAQEPELEFITYEHSSGAFSLDIPSSSEYGEEEEGVAFAHGESLLMVLFTPVETAPDAAVLEAAVTSIVDDALVREGLISSYDDLEVEVSEEGDAAVATFSMTSDQFGEGEGVLAMWQVEQTLYMLILLTPDYAAVEEVWQRAIDSLAVTPIEPPAPPEQPTATRTPPPPPPTPQPTATPPPTSNQGCYLIENNIGAQLTFTFTARDRQWTDTFTVPANGTKEYCLDPGRYTYTIDAPPPWGSTNGEIEVHAGERLRWPINPS
jgi:hypothetical protein